MKKITILALTATTVATIVAACGGTTKTSGNGEDQGDGSPGTSSGTASSGGSSGSNGGSSSGGDAETMTYTLGEGGPTVTTTLNCTSASTCGTQVCCGTGAPSFSGGTIGFSLTSDCAASPCGTGLTSFQLCATASECTTSGDSCQSLANAFAGAGAGGESLPDINVCAPEAGAATNPLADGGCATIRGVTYCGTADGGYTIVTDAASTATDSSTTTTTDSSTTTTTSDATSDGAGGG